MDIKITDSSQIASLLEKASIFVGQIHQPYAEGIRKFSINRLEVTSKNKIIFTFTQAPQLESARALSIHLNYRNISFSLDPDQFDLTSENIVSTLPYQAKALIERHFSRYLLPLNSQLQIDFSRIEKRAGQLNSSAHLLDVSKNGMALILKNCDKDQLIAFDHIWIKSIEGIKLHKPLFGRVVYSQPRLFKDGAVDVKAGISLEHLLDEEIFSSLKEKSQLVLR